MLDDHHGLAATAAQRLPPDREPPVAERTARHRRAPHLPGGDLVQRMTDEFALARPGHEDIA
ncbi:MAG: hypothetical protein ACRDNF_27165 [Streptosporangiaceae bacterium]